MQDEIFAEYAVGLHLQAMRAVNHTLAVDAEQLHFESTATKNVHRAKSFDFLKTIGQENVNHKKCLFDTSARGRLRQRVLVFNFVLLTQLYITTALMPCAHSRQRR